MVFIFMYGSSPLGLLRQFLHSSLHFIAFPDENYYFVKYPHLTFSMNNDSTTLERDELK